LGREKGREENRGDCRMTTKDQLEALVEQIETTLEYERKNPSKAFDMLQLGWIEALEYVLRQIEVIVE
tara:strand:+ start:3423 stop:3626 length:204 start_codon:yes stop_codon:yes gene_type:complete